MRLLIPADFSDTSKKAAMYGQGLASKFGAELTLIHVYRPIVSRNSPVYNLGNELYDDIRKETGLKMGEYYSELFESPFTHCTGVTRIGKTTDEITIEAARDENSIIIMGTHHNGGLKRWIAGSKTAEVIEKTDHPVLVVPSEGKLKNPENIAFITGCDSYDFVALEKLTRMAGALNASLYLIHISPEQNKSKDKVFRDFCERVKLQSGYEKIYSQIVKNNDVISGVSKYLESHQPDMLSFNVRKKVMRRRLLQKTFTEKLSSITGLPLLIFHRP